MLYHFTIISSERSIFMTRHKKAMLSTTQDEVMKLDWVAMVLEEDIKKSLKTEKPRKVHNPYKINVLNALCIITPVCQCRNCGKERAASFKRLAKITAKRPATA